MGAGILPVIGIVSTILLIIGAVLDYRRASQKGDGSTGRSLLSSFGAIVSSMAS